MKKSLCMIIVVLTLLALAACTQTAAQIEPQEPPEQEEAGTIYLQAETYETGDTNEAEPQPASAQYPLIFNSPGEEYAMQISPMPNSDFHVDLTPEQVDAVFPKVNLPLSGRGYYRADGTLVEVSASYVVDELNWHVVQINIGVGAPPIEFFRYGIDRDYVLEPSYVHGIYVMVLMIESWGNWFFQAEFNMDDIYFRIRFNHDIEPGQALLTQLVNNLILGGTEGLATLADPVIPELRSESLTLEEARLDTDFGRFVPTRTPAGYSFRWAYRSVRGHENENSLHMDWTTTPNYDSLYEVYLRWIETRGSDTEPWEFDQIFWGEEHLNWRVSTVREHELENLVSVDDVARYVWALYPVIIRPGRLVGFHEIPDDYWFTVHEPVFLAEELTLEVVQARVREWNSMIQAAEWYEDIDEADLVMLVPRHEISFSVLFGDVIVSVRAEEVSPEDIWAMFEEIIGNA